MKISKAIFCQEALRDRRVRAGSQKPALSVLKGPSNPEAFFMLFPSHFSLLTGLENAPGGFFQQTRKRIL